MINVEVQKNNNENAINIIKRFTKRVQGSGVLVRVRSLRYAERKESKYVRKKKTLKSLRRRTAHDLQVKLGKAVDNSR
jgi:ribosomal protein S21